MSRPNDLLQLLADRPHQRERLLHVRTVPARSAHIAAWPPWLDPVVRERLETTGIVKPWTHQVRTAELAWAGESVVVATGTGSGKSVGYLMPALTAARAGRRRGGTTLYLAPTKALAADQLERLQQLDTPGVVAAAFDGDTPNELRDLARARADYVLTNPDMLHRSILPGHRRWAGFLRALRFVVVDECHGYRGVFGSHVAQVLRRLRRICALYGSAPTFIASSGTTAAPGTTAHALIGLPATPVTQDDSPTGSRTFALWDPHGGSSDGRGLLTDAAELLADFTAAGARTIAFVRSRRAAETVAELTRKTLRARRPELVERVAAYRAGYLPHERRALEARLNDGTLLAVAATSALEQGIDIPGLDAVLIAGWPGTRASLWQRAGRAGRAGATSLTVMLAGDDPLDNYLIRHPEAIFGQPVEATVLDPDNPYVLAPHLCAAAMEHPLTRADLDLFGPSTGPTLADLEHRRLLRGRRNGSDGGGPEVSWHWTRRERAAQHVDLRGSDRLIALVERGTGRILGTVDAARAQVTAHTGAVYVHQGDTYVVDELDLHDQVAIAHAETPDYTTTARSVSALSLVERTAVAEWGGTRVAFGTVDVRSRVVGYLKRAVGSDRVLGEVPLDLPEHQLRTRAVWWEVSSDLVHAAGLDDASAPGAAHAAEHAAIGLLPLFANCDRWDIGGLSTVWHPDTEALTVFVHDGQPGGAGFAERGFHAARQWLTATHDAVATCPCAEGCPSCVQSPKCGSGNQPLHKSGASRLLAAILAASNQLSAVG